MQKQKQISLKLYIVFLIVFLIGAAVLAYPPISTWYNDSQTDKDISVYANLIEQEDVDYSSYLEAAREYNEYLRQTGSILTDPFDFEALRNAHSSYEDMLNVTEIMAIIDIPSINVHLPIYHGTEDSTLKKGIGHLSTTSLPVGGKGSHCVITGHTGLPGKTLFTDLIKLKEEDIFQIQVLGETLTYQVDDISVILPSEIQKLSLGLEEDYVTLITCTPYGVNSHRLLVRGTRIFPDQMTPEEAERVMMKAKENKEFTTIEIIQLAASAFAFLLFIVFLIELFRAIRANKRIKDEKE